MKLGVNSDVNLDLKKVGVRMMDGGPSKTNRPSSLPSNPVHEEQQNENKIQNHCLWILHQSQKNFRKRATASGSDRHQIKAKKKKNQTMKL